MGHQIQINMNRILGLHPTEKSDEVESFFFNKKSSMIRIIELVVSSMQENLLISNPGLAQC